MGRGGRLVYLGCFAEQAALEYARQPEVQAALTKLASAPAAEPSLSAEQAVAAAKDEGLTLRTSESSATGFKGVSTQGSGARPFFAFVRRGGSPGPPWLLCHAGAGSAHLRAPARGAGGCHTLCAGDRAVDVGG